MGAWGRGGDRAGRSSRPFTVWGWEDVDGRGGGSSARFEKATRLLEDSSAKDVVSSFVQHESELWEYLRRLCRCHWFRCLPHTAQSTAAHLHAWKLL